MDVNEEIIQQDARLAALSMAEHSLGFPFVPGTTLLSQHRACVRAALTATARDPRGLVTEILLAVALRSCGLVELISSGAPEREARIRRVEFSRSVAAARGFSPTICVLIALQSPRHVFGRPVDHGAGLGRALKALIGQARPDAPGDELFVRALRTVLTLGTSLYLPRPRAEALGLIAGLCRDLTRVCGLSVPAVSTDHVG